MEKICPECGELNPLRDDRNGQIVCRECGLILTERIPMLLEGGLIHPDRYHMGDPTKLSHWDKKLRTHIERRNVDINKKKIASSIQPQINRIRKSQQQLGPYTGKEYALFMTLDMLRSFSLLLNTKESIIDEAVMLLRKFFKNNNLAGRNYESFVAAIIYAACKLKKSPRNIEEVSNVTSINKKDIGRNYRFLCKTLKLQIPLLKLSEYLPRVAALSGVSMKVERRALEILDNFKEISGKTPWGIAGAVIYIAAKEYRENRTQKEIAKVAGVTEATLRNRYKEFKNLLKF